MSTRYWTENDWLEFAQLAIHAAMTDVARGKGWSEGLLHVARDALDLAIETGSQIKGARDAT